MLQHVFLGDMFMDYMFYDLAGNRIEEKEFIKKYNDVYYFLNSYEKEIEIEKIYNQN